MKSGNEKKRKKKKKERKCSECKNREEGKKVRKRCRIKTCWLC